MVGVQREPHQDVPQHSADYSELKAILATGSGETSAPPFNYLEVESEARPLIRNHQR